MEDLPVYVSIFFALTTALTLLLFYRAHRLSKTVWASILIWLIAQAALGAGGFYTITNTVPPRFLLLILPPLFIIAVLFFTEKGRHYIDSLNPAALTFLHVVRVPVEVTLFWLFLHQQIPQLMTFEGRNFDIVAGLTAPVIAYWGYTKARLGKPILLAWNFICLGLLLNIVIHAVLSVPTPFQKLAFDQPNVAVLHFPFVWLPCFIVPVVFFSHIASIRQLLKNKPAWSALSMPYENNRVYE